jgi:hypothetical protein
MRENADHREFGAFQEGDFRSLGEVSRKQYFSLY